ncbi:YbaB/EbfC family nucleoid-associated protein [Micromonospora sp. WMMD980]|uniref:YbaB/EbfC family nucleoid-associated protein n=1 Tax=Micromonospora sp. WMMD980 TaxID=3016088 RepID=UPI002416D500|nr:YbaB/EbfC family nucleoid-associated protein [Micromonospora sp. WMMD980]MDG4800988.1 YbaB/EbfC family nucleoid-associated protein [Micromonospora sp. WMMD980]
MWADEAALDAAGRRLDEWESGLAMQAARAKALSARTQALTGSARSDDGLVEVTVDAAGLLADLRLDERTRKHSAAHTARQVVATTRAACADLLRRLTEATAETLGADDPAARAIVESHRRRLDPDQGPPDARR